MWCYFETPEGQLASPRLLLATQPTCHPVDVILAYARRFYIEPVFDDVKNRWGWKASWQQHRRTLHRWVHLLFVSYTIPKLLTLGSADTLKTLCAPIPWRPQTRPTAGLIRLGIQQIFRHLPIRDAWDRKSQKFVLPQHGPYQGLPPPHQKAA